MSFEARFGGVCHSEACDRDNLIEAGQMCDYEDDRLVHTECAWAGLNLDGPRSSQDDETALVRVTGRRKPQRCPACNLEHNGECW